MRTESSVLSFTHGTTAAEEEAFAATTERNYQEEPRIILPPSAKTTTTKSKKASSNAITDETRSRYRLVGIRSSYKKDKTEPSRLSLWRKQISNKIVKKLQKPGTQFRAGLLSMAAAFAGLALLRGGSASSSMLSSLAISTQTWIQHRGFQGLAAFGRTFTYIWAVFVAYPKMLDRRAAERKSKQRDQQLEQRRKELRGLAAEVSRLQQELASIDAEIRSFRREIISMKAMMAASKAQKQGGGNVNNNNILWSDNGDATASAASAPKLTPPTHDGVGDDDSVQEAIAAEMAHLAQIRADTQASLTVARQLWAEAKAQSPPEAWPTSAWLYPPSSSSTPSSSTK